MFFSRRAALRGMLGALATLQFVRRPEAQSMSDFPPHPDASKFQAGDFLWTARPDEFIPYDTSGQLTEEADARRWTAARDAFVRHAQQSGDPALQDAAKRLQGLTYEEFRSLYLDDRSVGDPIQFSGRTLSVGHVAILDIGRQGAPEVIEASPPVDSARDAALHRFPNGVIRSPYKRWIAEHSEYRVWHGRVRGFGPLERRRIGAEAGRLIGRDYWFWGFNLLDDSCFYCSKLCWLSAFRALKIALDGNENGARSFWLSPKRLINSATIEMIHSAGPYGK